MAQIKEFSSADLNTISRFGGVSNVLDKINGVTVVAPAGTFLLDTTYGSGAAAAYSVRRLATAATVLMRVRRETAGGAGDDDEADVAYDSNNILSLDSAISNASAGVTATTLGQFINVGTVGGTTYTNPDSLAVTASCYVDTWYDQAGSNDAVQNAQANQPQIHDGTVDTDLIKENGKPSVMFETGQGSPNMDITGIIPRSQFAVVKTSNAEQNSGILEPDNPVLHYANNGNLKVHRVTISIAASNPLNQKLVSSIADGASSQHHVNDESSTTAVSTYYGGDVLGGRAALSNRQCVPLQEYVAYSTVVSGSDYTGIRNNINSSYLIYQPTTQPTSGLLYDYGSATGGTDAAAAYSVRQLSDKAVLCMRIRRDMGVGNPGDDDETNIGFDANGDLDTQAIADFCGSGTGYVTRWWDQSVNGDHADQDVPESQPQIYNGTAVITENNKPAIDFDVTSLTGGLLLSNFLDTTNDYSVSYVFRYDTNDCVLFNFTDTTNIIAATAGKTASTLAGLTYKAAGRSDVSGAATLGNQIAAFSTHDFSTPTTTLSIDGSTASGSETSRGHFRDSRLGVGSLNATHLNGVLQEIIVWPTDQSSNRTGIESNIDDYFSIT